MMRKDLFHIGNIIVFLVLPFSSTISSTTPPDGGGRASSNEGVVSPPLKYNISHGCFPPPSTTAVPPTAVPPLDAFGSLTPEAAAVPRNITWWCSKTPHPEQCNYYFKKSPHGNYQAPIYLSDFRTMLVELALDQAVATRAHTVLFGPNCTSGVRRAAWWDCVKLYDDTVLQLNRTLRGLSPKSRSKTKCTDFDAQTWLSTAQTDIDTCRLGSEDLKVTVFVSPANKNLSDLISNCLAVNGVLMMQQNHTANYGKFFPSWISRHERRLLLSSSLAKYWANVVVARDGSGHFRSIQAAINLAARRRSMSRRYVIYVKGGIYRENIEVDNNNDNIMLVGDGIKATMVVGSRSVRGGYTTYNSATAGFGGTGFIAKGITFLNTAGPRQYQAVAVRTSSDLSVFYRVAFIGYQDTLYIHSQRQFYRECYISGTIDFIFGNAAAVFQNCIILVRRPLHGQSNVITAQARGDPFQNTGITIHSSRIMAASELKPVVQAYKTYLGRPWQAYSRVVIIKTFMDSFISPLGWSPWLRGSKFALDTVFYGEYKNFGPGSSTRWRVQWKGFHAITSADVASRFSVESLIAGDSWLPATGVPFKSGL